MVHFPTVLELLLQFLRISEISYEFFQEPIVRVLACVIDHAIKVDENTKARSMCHYRY